MTSPKRPQLSAIPLGQHAQVLSTKSSQHLPCRTQLAERLPYNSESQDAFARSGAKPSYFQLKVAIEL